MQYIDYLQPKDEQQGTWQPNHTPTTEWQNTRLLSCCLQSLHSKDLKYDWASQQRKPIGTEQWPSRSSSIRTDPSHQALHPKSNYMTHLNEIGALLFSNKPNQHSLQPIRNLDRILITTLLPNRKKRICSLPLKKNTIIHPQLQ